MIRATMPLVENETTWRKCGGFESEADITELKKKMASTEEKRLHPTRGIIISKADGTAISY
jgi:hypothetical protein